MSNSGDNCVHIRTGKHMDDKYFELCRESERDLIMIDESTEVEQRIAVEHDGWLSVGDVQSTEVEWLWNPYIPLGKLTLFDGDPAVGKSWASCALAAAVTRGDGLPGVIETEPRNVLLLSAEDSLTDTIRPRLEGLRADLDRVKFHSAITLDESGLEKLETKVGQLKPALIILDPLFAFVGGKKDIYRDNEVRTFVTPLARLAEAYGCAIVAVRHLTKMQQKAIYAGGGSMAFIGAARSALLFGHDLSNTQKFGFVHAKSNLAPKGGAVGYRIERTLNGRGEFVWTGESDLTAEQILGMPDCKGKRAPTTSRAKDFLRETLRDGPLPAKEIGSRAKSMGISTATLRRASEEMGIISSRESEGNGGDGKWLWKLPMQPAFES
jgi:putative DNA primase/helicase